MISWHTLHVKHQCEATVAEALSGRSVLFDGVQMAPGPASFETFWPHRVTRDNRKREYRRPWFPGYLFVRLDWSDPVQRLRILRLEELLAVLAVDGKPCIIPESEIESLRILAASKAQVSQHPFVAIGEDVRVVRGPLAGVQGKVMRFKGAALLVVQVEMLGKAVACELDPDVIEAVARRSLRAA